MHVGGDAFGDCLGSTGEGDISVEVALVVNLILDLLAEVVHLAFLRSPAEYVLVEVDSNHFEWGEEAVLDALLERVGVDRVAEVVDVGDVLRFLRGSRHAHLDCGLEVVEDLAPSRILASAAAMALVDHDTVKKVRRELVVDRLVVFVADDGLV